MSSNDDAAGGVQAPAAPVLPKKVKNVMYCSECSFHLLLVEGKSECSSCKKEMKKIGVIEYA